MEFDVKVRFLICLIVIKLCMIKNIIKIDVIIFMRCLVTLF